MEQEQQIAAYKAIEGAAAIAGKSLVAFSIAAEGFVNSIYAMFWHQYILEGAVYGETPKGFERWLKERREVTK